MTEKDILKRVIEENLANKEMIRQKVLYAAKKEMTTNNKDKGSIFNMKKKFVAIPAVLCISFAIMVNTSSVFAATVADIPILGAIAKVVTIREYTHNSDADETRASIPNVTNTGNEEMEKRINKEIDQKMQELTAKVEAEAAEYKKNFLAMGNKESDFIPMQYDFDYKVYSSSKDTLSFVISQTEKNSTSQKYFDESGVPEKAEYVTLYMYNINLKSGEDIGLKDILGADFKKIADAEVERQVKERAKNDENLLSYYEEFYASKGAKGIEDNQQFYINEAGNPVLVFDKYVIAPEYAGIQEFEIQK